MKLENWSVISQETPDPYIPPELIILRLRGNVYGHSTREDGEMICTSSIVGLNGDAVVVKSGHEYLLGTVDAEYEKLYPNARKRFFNTLREE